jgi:hypothetical protein
MPGPIDDVWRKVLALIGRGKAEGSTDPDDPYAMVGAPKKPRPPLRRSSIAIEPER